MKKILTLLVIVIMLFCSIPFSVSAENNVAEMYVKSTPNWMYDYEISDKFVFPDYFTVGRTISMNFSLTGVSTLDLWEFDVVYNSDVLEFVKINLHVVLVPEVVGAVPDRVPSAKAEVVSDEKVHITVKSDPGVKKQYFYVNLSFEVKNTGASNVSVKNTLLRDCDGKNYDVIVNTDRVPVKAVESHSIPEVKPDYEKTLSYHYGSSNYVTTELSYPMTVNEFISTVQVADENCEKMVVNDKGERLNGDEKIPTGARFIVLYDGFCVFATNIVLIGDVDGNAQINAADARKVLRYAASIDTDAMDAAEIAAANTASDTEDITASDAREILRFSAGIGQSYEEWYEYHCKVKKYYPWLINDNL